MAVKNITDLLADADNNIPSSQPGEVSAADVRNLFKHVIESAINRLTDSLYLNLKVYATNRNYLVGECCVYQNDIYICIADTAGTFAPADWKEIANVKSFKLRGFADCSGSPNYPEGLVGDTYIVSVSGKIGGASGKTVVKGDMYICNTDNGGGVEGAVGAYWTHINISGVGNSLASLAIGNEAEAEEAGGVAVGPLAKATGQNSTALGYSPDATGDYSTAVGDNAQAVQEGDTAVGSASEANGGSATAVGKGSTATGLRSTAFGANAEALGDDSNAIGNNITSNINKTTRIGGPMIIGKHIAAEDVLLNFSSAKVLIATPEVDFKVSASNTINIPTGARFFADEVHVIVTDADTVTVQPTVHAGWTGTIDGFVSDVATSGLTAAGKRHIFYPLSNSEGKDSLVVGITDVATATTLKGRFVFTGILIENQ